MPDRPSEVGTVEDAEQVERLLTDLGTLARVVAVRVGDVDQAQEARSVPASCKRSLWRTLSASTCDSAL